MAPSSGGADESGRGRGLSGRELFRDAGRRVQTAHMMSPQISSRSFTGIGQSARHTRARRTLPSDVLTWTPEHVVTWVEGLDLHG